MDFHLQSSTITSIAQMVVVIVISVREADRMGVAYFYTDLQVVENGIETDDTGTILGLRGKIYL